MAAKIKFVKSAVLPKEFPGEMIREVAIVGRSNAGKSSLINGMAGGRVAKVSQTPGKTRLLNFFQMGDSYRIVDMPGYGFAARSNSEIQSWEKMVESYFSVRGQLKVLVLVMDIRREWTAQEEQLKSFAHRIGRPVVVALTKSDKLRRGPRLQRQKKIIVQSGLSDCICVSANDQQSCAEFEKLLFKNYIENEEA